MPFGQFKEFFHVTHRVPQASLSSSSLACLLPLKHLSVSGRALCSAVCANVGMVSFNIMLYDDVVGGIMTQV